MTPAATVLVACEDPFTTRILEHEAKHTPGTDLVLTREGGDTAQLAIQSGADAVICAASVGGIDGLEICRALKADGRSAHSLVLFLAVHGDRDTKAKALQSGVDGFLTLPLEPEEVRAALLQARRIRALRDHLKQTDARLKETGRQVDQVVSLLVNLIDARLPGAALRGETMAGLARRVADRFDIPSHLLRELDYAAHLQEIGKIAGRTSTVQSAVDAPACNGPAYTIVSRAVLSQLDWLAGAAEVIGAMCENWDGTGLPGRLHKGQIPLRSRILRVLVDFMDALAEPNLPQATDVAAALGDYSGTLYDPLVVVHFQAVVGARPDPDRDGSKTRMLVGELREGMVLADDIYTSSGVKLLASGAVLNAATLDVIRHRHQVDPVVSGVWVQSCTD